MGHRPLISYGRLEPWVREISELVSVSKKLDNEKLAELLTKMRKDVLPSLEIAEDFLEPKEGRNETTLMRPFVRLEYALKYATMLEGLIATFGSGEEVEVVDDSLEVVSKVIVEKMVNYVLRDFDEAAMIVSLLKGGVADLKEVYDIILWGVTIFPKVCLEAYESIP